jgi:hypothetical protein
MIVQSASSKVELPHVERKVVLHKSNQISTAAKKTSSLLGLWHQRKASGAWAANHKHHEKLSGAKRAT